MFSLSFYDNWSMRRKLMTSFTLVSMLSAGVGAVALVNMAGLTRVTEQMYTRETRGVSLVKEANINLIYIAKAIRMALLSGTAAAR